MNLDGILEATPFSLRNRGIPEIPSLFSLKNEQLSTIFHIRALPRLLAKRKTNESVRLLGTRFLLESCGAPRRDLQPSLRTVQQSAISQQTWPSPLADRTRGQAKITESEGQIPMCSKHSWGQAEVKFTESEGQIPLCSKHS